MSVPFFCLDDLVVPCVSCCADLLAPHGHKSSFQWTVFSVALAFALALYFRRYYIWGCSTPKMVC